MPGPRFLIGDFNLPGAVPRLVTGWTQLGRLPTYPSWRPRVQLDHVLADQPMPVQCVRALRLAVSDHCALVVDLGSAGARTTWQAEQVRAPPHQEEL